MTENIDKNANSIANEQSGNMVSIDNPDDAQPDNIVAAEKSRIPIPVVTGNAQIQILKYEFIKDKDMEGQGGKGVTITLKNTSGAHIGRAVFQAVFYDSEGNVVNKCEKDTWDFESNSSRILAIYPNSPEPEIISSYEVKLVRVIMSPVPAATGNDAIEILNHIFLEGNNPFGSPIKGGGVELSVKNKTDKTIATAVYNAVFYDLEGNVIDTVKYRDMELKPHSSRAIVIESDKLIGEPARCYNVSILKTVTSDIEKVQIRKHERQRMASGQERISGLLKNISDVKSDAAVIVTFTDYQNEKAGTEVLYVKDIEPHSTKKFNFVFDNPEGAKIKTYTIDVGDITE